MIQNRDNLGRVGARAARRSVVQLTITLAIAATAALAASVTDANASARELSASSYGFGDLLLPNTGLEHLRTLSSPVADWALRCFASCGPAFGTNVVRRSGLLTSNDADVSGKKVVDATGRAMGVSGMSVIERLESDGFGADWVVVGTHVGQQWLPLVVPFVFRHFVGCASASE